jgi:hypothetical protein
MEVMARPYSDGVQFEPQMIEDVAVYRQLWYEPSAYLLFQTGAIGFHVSLLKTCRRPKLAF